MARTSGSQGSCSTGRPPATAAIQKPVPPARIATPSASASAGQHAGGVLDEVGDGERLVRLRQIEAVVRHAAALLMVGLAVPTSMPR